MRRFVQVMALTVASALVPVASAVAGGPGDKGKFPSVIPLPAGWQPEGIATGKGTSFYVGSLATGAVYKGDLRTGKGAQLVAPQGKPAVGLKVDRLGRIFVAGGASGTGSVYAPDGTLLKTYTFASGTTFVNDVVVTRLAAWFTDSQQSRLYRVDLGKDGALAASAVTVPLTGEYAPGAGFNVNGIDATPDAKWLVIVQSGTGTLYRVDPSTGATKRIVLAGGASVPNGDGILLDGRTLFVVQNQLNRVALVRLASDLLTGSVRDTITDPDLDVPTTIARFGDSLYAVNARFGTTDPQPAKYDVVKLPRER